MRSKAEPDGFDPAEIETAVGNLYFMQGALLSLVQQEAGNSSLEETPRSNLLKGSVGWRACLADGMKACVFDWCRCGRDYRKTTDLIVSEPWMMELERRCCCKELQKCHVHLSGAATTEARAYA